MVRVRATLPRAFARIQAELEAVKSSAAGEGDGEAGDLVVEILRTSHDGQFPLAQSFREQQMVYNDLTAVAVRIRHRQWRPGVASRAVMVSVHVDTIHVTAGGSDNGANVGIAVELVRNVAARGAEDPEAVRNAAVVVVFSSAEEEGFMGAHGVVTSHPWQGDAG